MAKRSNQKLKLLYLTKILLDNTNEQKGLTLSQILRELQKYGISAERKSIYDDMEALRVFGIDVRTCRDRYVRYYVAERKFNNADIKLIFDLISSNGILNDKNIRTLLKKFDNVIPETLLDAASYEQKTVREIEDIYTNLSVICDAICYNKEIKFKYFEWNSRKQRIMLYCGEYLTVSPIKLTFNDGRYMLECINRSTRTKQIYYLDRMINTLITNTKRDIDSGEFEKAISASKVENVRLRCDNCLAGDVFYRFGLGVTILANREEYFEVSVKTAISASLFAWIYTYGGGIKIVGPDWVENEYFELLNELKNID